MQRPEIAEAAGGLELRDRNRGRLAADRSLQAVDEGIELLGRELAESAEARIDALLHLAVGVAIALDEL